MPATFAIVVAAAVLAGAAGTVSTQRARVILVSLDGGADWLVDRWMSEGKAPAFARLAQDGTVADAMIPAWPSLTAPSHATLWTGAPPRTHRIIGNKVPVLPNTEHTVLEQQSGYLSGPLAAEPIWITAARADRRVLVLQATQGAPFAKTFPDRLLQFDVFANELARMAVVEGSLAQGAYRFAIGGRDASLEPALDGSVQLSVGDERAGLWPRAGARWSGTLRVRVGGRDGFARVGLLRYDQASGAFALLRGRVSEIVSSDPAERDAFVRTAGTIIDGGVVGAYGRGRFGPTLWEGGSGEAERALADAISANQDYADAGLAYAATRPWDLLVAYNPNLDLVQHALLGLVDPASSRYDPAVAARAWPLMEQMFARSGDEYVALLRRRFPDAAVIVTSDHGTEGAGRSLYPNAILAQAGLLVLGPDGAVDLSRTKAVYLDGRGGGIAINGAEWKCGIVGRQEREAVKRAVTEALLGARDPDNGAHVVRAVFDADRDGEGLGFGGPGVDLIFDSAPDYAAEATITSSVIAAPSGTIGEGEHGPSPYRRKLQAIFYAAGPGIRRGARLPIIHSTDVAPTVAALLGIPPPRDSVGHVLEIQLRRH